MSSTDDRGARRARTVDAVLDRALVIMGEVGVGGLTMTALARAMSIQPPSLYKYFPSVLAVHDELFRRGQQANLEALEQAMDGAAPGLDALRSGLTGAARWAVANPVLAQLLFWRPVPGFVPSGAAYAPAGRLVGHLRRALAEAVARGELVPAATDDETLTVLASLHFGVISQHLANDPGTGWDDAAYPRAYDRVLDLFVAGYRPKD